MSQGLLRSLINIPEGAVYHFLRSAKEKYLWILYMSKKMWVHTLIGLLRAYALKGLM